MISTRLLCRRGGPEKSAQKSESRDQRRQHAHDEYHPPDLNSGQANMSRSDSLRRRPRLNARGRGEAVRRQAVARKPNSRLA